MRETNKFEQAVSRGGRLVRGTFAKMEEELNCTVCHKPYSSPIILPCSHSICLNCSKTCLTTTGSTNHNMNGESGGELGEADNENYVSLVEFNHLYQTIGNLPCLKCPVCGNLFPLDNRGVKGFLPNRLLENIVNRYYTKSNGNIYCQLCEANPPKKANVMCEQCEVAYCDKCCQTCHPSRGPLAKHNLIPPSSLKASTKAALVKCSHHREENISMYCVFCRIPVCYLCVERGQHSGHEVKAMGKMFKEQKDELSVNVKALSEKKGLMQNILHHLHENCAVIQENGLEFEARVVAQCDALISLVQERKGELIHAIAREVSTKSEKVRQEISVCDKRLKSVSALSQYAKEALKETDPASFMLVANSLNTRVVDACAQWSSEVKQGPLTSTELDLTLDLTAVVQALNDIHFVELKAPTAPEIVADLCSVENNAITLSWKPHKQSCVDGYVVELDDGKGGTFIEVYRGDSLECTVTGLQFDSTYRARVKGYNKSGQGPPSDEVYLTTSDVAWFALDPLTAHSDIVLTNDSMTSTCTSFDDRVVLGDIGFARGCHYWEITIDRYNGNPDPAVGVAYGNTIRDSILGKDDKAWSMYIDSSRSWFRHKNEHSNRREGGIEVGSVIGVLLDCTNHTLSFYLNDERRGAIRLPNTDQPLFPAFSLNRNAQITLHTGLELPEKNAT